MCFVAKLYPSCILVVSQSIFSVLQCFEQTQAISAKELMNNENAQADVNGEDDDADLEQDIDNEEKDDDDDVEEGRVDDGVGGGE